MKTIPPQHGQLLQATLADPGRAEAAWRCWRSGADIDTLDGASLSLLPLLFRRRPEWWVDDPWWGRISGLCRWNWYFNQCLIAEAVEGLVAMNALGIEVMLIDDLATLKLVHCDLGVLKLDEVSLLVREEDRVGATEALELRGWRLKSGNIPLPGLPASMQTLRYEHDGIGRIALRTCLLPPPCLPFGNVWETATMGEIGSLAVRVPALAEHLPWALMACVSPTGASTLVRLASVVILINSAGALDWDQFVKIVRENRAVQLAATALAELDRFVPLPAVIPALLAAAPATAAECRYSEARVRGGVRHDWALFKLLRERGDLSIQRSNMSFSYFLMCSRGGGTIIGTLRWAGRAIRQRLT